MTLILSTAHKNGVCVLADKRNITSNGTINDNLYKIYKFGKIPLIIYNHGVNKFNNKTWEEYCHDYENKNKWIHYNFIGICSNFKKFIEENIRQELETNFNNKLSEEYTKSGFVFCGKTIRDAGFKIRELFWSFDSDGLNVEEKNHGNLVLSGDGQECLKPYLDINKNIFTNEYWENLDETHAAEELKKLFLVGMESKNNQLCADEFSDEFDIECI